MDSEGSGPLPHRGTMNEATHMAAKAQSQAAADWVARLGGEPGEADWLAFEAWLDAAPVHRAAYDKALALSLEIERGRAALATALADKDAARPDRASPRRSRTPALWWSGAMMSVAAVAVTFAVLHPEQKPLQPDVYATAKGERRDIVLSDGTKIALNTASSVTVSMQPQRREITLAQGEAAFTVTHDANRPFVVHVGDRVLTDLGTDFEVLRQNGTITVTVREGLVGVQRAGDGQRDLKLGPGMRLDHREGSPDSMVLVANTDEAFAWRAGRLIYRDRPLSEVAADLDRYGQDQVRVQGPAAGLRFSGVLTIDNQPAMVQRLTDLLPVSSSRKDGVIILSGLNNTRQ
jgi:transmembrane sensor